MSRLSRFKKVPSLKLAKAPTQPHPILDSDSDDDFIKLPKFKLERNAAQKDEKNSNLLKGEKEPLTSGDSSVSEYFSSSKENQLDKPDKPIVEKKQLLTAKNDPTPSNDVKVKTEPSSHSSKTNRRGMKVGKAYKVEVCNKDPSSEPASLDPECATVDMEGTESESEGRTKCPFCFKDLRDKLTGTTHIKSCAKDLPTEQVIKVMELYEKQIKEWQELGLPCPGGFKTKSKNTSSKNNKGGGKGRRKKEAIVEGGADPALELALALSISLHEEVESRKETNVKNHLLLGRGQENEIEHHEVVQSSSSSSTLSSRCSNDEEKQQNLKPHRPPTTSTSGTTKKRRGKKLQLDTLPLFTVDDSRKKAIIEERVGKILDETEGSQDQKFKIRDEGLVEKIRIPRRLAPLQNKECSLWTLAQGGEEIPNESFSVLELNLDKRPIVELEQPVDCQTLGNENLENKIVAPIDDPLTTSIKQEARVETKISTVVDLRPPSKSKRQSSSYPSLQSLKSLSPVIRDIATMLYERTSCDIILYGREEKQIKCHRFMLMARCPKLLKKVIVEVINNGHKRNVIPLTDFSHDCVHAFIWYLYTGCVFTQEESLVFELKNLGRLFEIEVTPDDQKDARGEKFILPQSQSKTDISTQVEKIATVDSSTMTLELAEQPVNLKRTNKSINRSTQELFTTIMEDCPNIPCSPSPNINEVASPLKEGPEGDLHNSSRDLFEEYEDGLDLSLNEQDKNLENDERLLTNNSFRMQEYVENEYDEAFSKHEGIDAQGFFKGEEKPVILDEDGIDLDDIGSPTNLSPRSRNSSGCGRKRSRSVSPIRLDVTGYYGATQLARIIEKKIGAKSNEGSKDSDSIVDSNVDGLIFQANKKHKLDNIRTDLSICSQSESNQRVNNLELLAVEKNERVGSLNLNMCCDNYLNTHCNCSIKDDEAILQAASELEKGKKWSNNTSFSSPVGVGVGVFVPTPKAAPNYLKLRKCGSTPNLSSNLNDNSSFFHHEQNNHEDNEGNHFGRDDFDDDENDPFGLDGNDTLFANLKTPEIMKSVRRKPATIVTIDEDTPPSRNSQIGRRFSFKELSLEKCDTTDTDNQDFNINGKQTGRKKQPKKGKSKNGATSPKVKLPSRLPSPPPAQAPPITQSLPRNGKSFASSQPQPTISNSKPSTSNAPRSKNGAATPLLNYSLIDTPILKQELKKYGLRAVPRSKAKVLLRYIYHETHKD